MRGSSVLYPHVNCFWGGFLTHHNNNSIGSSTKIFTHLIVSFLHWNVIIYVTYCWTAVSFLLNQSTIVKCNHPFFPDNMIIQSQATVEPLGQWRERFKSIVVAVDASTTQEQRDNRWPAREGGAMRRDGFFFFFFSSQCCEEDVAKTQTRSQV